VSASEGGIIAKLCKRLGSVFAYRVFIPFFDLAFRLDSHNIERWRQRYALAETGLFVEQHMSLTLLKDCRRTGEMAISKELSR